MTEILNHTLADHSYPELNALYKNDSFSYADIIPPGEISGFRKQSAKRHFGVHGYFTRQVWSVVRTYIERFTLPGDCVLDPFGGSGVTAIEALMTGRRACHIDINPLSVFITRTLLTPVDSLELTLTFEELLQKFECQRPRNVQETHSLLKQLHYPKNVALPRSADVATVDKLFSQQQLAELALLRHLIMKTEEENIRQYLLLMFSGLLNKINLTYHASAGRSAGRGDSGMFRYYRYRLAKDSPSLEITDVFRSRLKKVLAAREELKLIDPLAEAKGLANVYKGSATQLTRVSDNSVDYIYTDPPYGARIPYLDLSTMWNAWLDFPVMEEDRALEAIEGGERLKSRADYGCLMAESIAEMFRVLKPDRWMSMAFSHTDPACWELIVDAAEKAGFEYVSATRQSNGQTSFKKRQNPFSVITGQLILNFRKTTGPRPLRPCNTESSGQAVVKLIWKIISVRGGATLDEINADLMIAALEKGFLSLLSREYSDLGPLLRQHFLTDADGKWYKRKPE